MPEFASSIFARIKPDLQKPGGLVICSLAVVAVSFWYGYVSFDQFRYMTNDDPTMIGILTGVFSQPGGDARLIYQSAFLGAIYLNLVKIFPGLDWYALFQLLISAAAFFTICFRVLSYTKNSVVIILLCTLGCLYFSPLLYFIQFTHTSMLCVLACCILLIETSLAERPVRQQARLLSLALFFAVLGAMIRSASLLVLLCIVLALIGYQFIHILLIRQRNGLLEKCFSLIVFLAVAYGLVWLIRAAELAVFYNTPEWQTFISAYKNRAFVFENWPSWFSSDQIAAMLKNELSISYSQYRNMKSWIPIDKNLYSAEKLEVMANLIKSHADTGPSVVDRLIHSLNGYIQIFQRDINQLSTTGVLFVELAKNALSFTLITSIILATSNLKKAPQLLCVSFVWTAITIIVLLGIQAFYRFPPARIYMSIAIIYVCCTLFCQLHYMKLTNTALPDLIPENNKLTYASLIIASLFLILLFFSGKGIQRAHKGHKVFFELKSSMQCKQSAWSTRGLRLIQAERGGEFDGKIFLAPGVIHSTCYIRPFSYNYPDILKGRTIGFGWRNLTPWLYEDIFGGNETLFSNICAEKNNVFLIPATKQSMVRDYLKNHLPQYRLEAALTGSRQIQRCLSGNQ